MVFVLIFIIVCCNQANYLFSENPKRLKIGSGEWIPGNQDQGDDLLNTTPESSGDEESDDSSEASSDAEDEESSSQSLDLEAIYLTGDTGLLYDFLQTGLIESGDVALLDELISLIIREWGDDAMTREGWLNKRSHPLFYSLEWLLNHGWSLIELRGELEEEIEASNELSERDETSSPWESTSDEELDDEPKNEIVYMLTAIDAFELSEATNLHRFARFGDITDGENSIRFLSTSNPYAVNFWFNESIPLHVAARHNQAAFCGMLLGHGADTHSTDKFCYYPHTYAIELGNVDMLYLFFLYGAPIDTYTVTENNEQIHPLEKAAIIYDLQKAHEITLMLIKLGVNLPEPQNRSERLGLLLRQLEELVSATIENDLNKIADILKKDCPDKDIVVAACIAAANNYLSALELLLPRISDEKNFIQILEIAIVRGHGESVATIVAALFEKNSSPAVVTQAVALAIRHQHEAIIELLVNLGSSNAQAFQEIDSLSKPATITPERYNWLIHLRERIGQIAHKVSYEEYSGHLQLQALSALDVTLSSSLILFIKLINDGRYSLAY